MCVNHIEKGKEPSFVAHDFTIDSTFATVNAGRPALKGTYTQSISDIAHIQNDFRRRKSLQKHNKQKKYRKLRQARGRQKNRVNDALLL
ncbi:MAG: hypothetical protein QXN95_03145 [Candidatus Bathyarchaeia archaeon]